MYHPVREEAVGAVGEKKKNNTKEANRRIVREYDKEQDDERVFSQPCVLLTRHKKRKRHNLSMCLRGL